VPSYTQENEEQLWCSERTDFTLQYKAVVRNMRRRAQYDTWAHERMNIHRNYPSCLVLLNLTSWATIGEGYKLWRSSLCNFLPRSVNLSFRSNTTLSTLFFPKIDRPRFRPIQYNM
jgi:hypothetical protein